jgi:SAM-dependent methyltransferase
MNTDPTNTEQRGREYVVTSGPLFDHYADSYDADLDNALSVTGSGKDYFAQNRVAWTAACVKALGIQPRSAMDYGCGNGSTTPLMLSILGAARAIGVDVSPKIIAKAREEHGASNISFAALSEPQPSGAVDVAYCNGVFHHIDTPERAGALDYIHRSLGQGGLFSIWENNPWNPATHYVMSRCAFDKGAQMLSVVAMRKLLGQCGFKVVRSDFLFIFPGFLEPLRPTERWVCKLPLGAQYHVLAQKD